MDPKDLPDTIHCLFDAEVDLMPVFQIEGSEFSYIPVFESARLAAEWVELQKMQNPKVVESLKKGYRIVTSHNREDWENELKEARKFGVNFRYFYVKDGEVVDDDVGPPVPPVSDEDYQTIRDQVAQREIEARTKKMGPPN